MAGNQYCFGDALKGFRAATSEERYAEVWQPGDDFPRQERQALHWSPQGATGPFTIELTELFREGTQKLEGFEPLLMVSQRYFLR